MVPIRHNDVIDRPMTPNEGFRLGCHRRRVYQDCVLTDRQKQPVEVKLFVF
jgi:hypothetical protein